MRQSPILVVSSATTLDTQGRPVKSITLDALVADVTWHPSLDCVLNITEATQVFTVLGTKVSLNTTGSRKNICTT